MGLVGSILFAVLYVFFTFRSPMEPGNLVRMLAQGMMGALSGPATAFAVAMAAPAVWPALALHFITWGSVSPECWSSSSAFWVQQEPCGCCRLPAQVRMPEVSYCRAPAGGAPSAQFRGGRRP